MLKKLKDFFKKINYPSAQPLLFEALDFLDNPENKGRYFILECAEIFVMEHTSVEAPALSLLKEIKDLRPKINEALYSLQHKKIEVVAKLFGQKQKSERCD